MPSVLLPCSSWKLHPAQITVTCECRVLGVEGTPLIPWKGRRGHRDGLGSSPGRQARIWVSSRCDRLRHDFLDTICTGL